jgi:prepilin-type N-terminal cleavage/methylation domain-containing protein
MPKRRRSGFTLIELMIVGAIIGVLAIIALPKFANMVVKAQEASVKGKLGALRGALTIYCADNDGRPLQYTGGITIGVNYHPVVLPLITPRYIDAIPKIRIPTPGVHRGTWDSRESDGATTVPPGDIPNSWGTTTTMGVTMVGGDRYFYDDVNDNLRISCTHTDTTGRVWSTW